MTGHVDATLGARPNINVNLRVPGTLDVDEWLGVSPDRRRQAIRRRQPRRSAARGDRQADRSRRRCAPSTPRLARDQRHEVASLKIAYADLEATLRNGICTISKLTGQFYGGAVDFSGTHRRLRNALAVDLKGSLQGIYFGEMLRGTAGTNSFGDQNLTRGGRRQDQRHGHPAQGQRHASPEEIRNSLSGHGQVSGYVYPAVAKGSLGLGVFATGVGSIFSTEHGVRLGDAVGPSSIARIRSRARSSIGGGAVTLHNPTVQGQNDVATIASTHQPGGRDHRHDDQRSTPATTRTGRTTW